MKNRLALLAICAAIVAAGCNSADSGDASKPVQPGSAVAPGGPSGSGPAVNSQTATPGS